jgi:hypothetical protein
MSSEALSWAKSRNVKTKTQRELLLAMADSADPSGRLWAPLSQFHGLAGIDTPKQLMRAADSLVAAGLACKMWHPDSHVWLFDLVMG